MRADVDEAGVAQLRGKPRSYITARSFSGQKFWGQVVQIGEHLGKKTVQTDEPREHVGKKILETLVQLDAGHEFASACESMVTSRCPNRT